MPVLVTCFLSCFSCCCRGPPLVSLSGRESPIIAGYNTFPRFFIRRVFQAGLAIALRMEGRAKTGTLRVVTSLLSCPPDDAKLGTLART